MADKKARMKRSNSEISSSSSSSTTSFSSDEETDARDLKPIRGYLSNRRELARQLFKSVKNDKIRMMLPQILKNMNFSDLEEWCASELCGMSEARILSILNGQPMLESSDTSETDDSGPSLEIISDTEEWLTDTDVPIKEENALAGASKTKRLKAKAKKVRQDDKTKGKSKGKSTGNSGAAIVSDVKIKTEKAKGNKGSTTKEGESLLDLLELEMRARAIRALIRKEEDIIPSAASEKRMTLTANALRNTLNSAVSASLSTEKNFNEKFNLGESPTENKPEKNSAEKPGRNVRSSEGIEDEDVVFVVTQPTPTIELLSSESENDNEKEKPKENNETKEKSTKSTNKTLEKNDERTSQLPLNCDITPSTNQRIVTINKSSDRPDSLKIVITKNVSESFSTSSSTIKTGKTKKNSSEKAHRNFAANESDKKTENIAPEASLGQGLFKKIKKKHNLRTKRKSDEESRTDREKTDDSLEKTVVSPLPSPAATPSVSSSSPPENNEANFEKKDEAPAAQDANAVKIKIEDIKQASGSIETSTRVENDSSKRISEPVAMDDDRLDDFEEIIDLDDYPDDMDEIENSDNVDPKTQEPCKIVGKETTNATPEKASTSDVSAASNPTTTAKEGSDSSETWATRYYQTDDVQNVIKESKIQSEIRKRLRERQRLSKLNSSPKLNSPGDSTNSSEKIEEKTESKPTGSVQEYLALKNATSNQESVANVSAEANKSSQIPTNDAASPINHSNVSSAMENVDLETQIT